MVYTLRDLLRRAGVTSNSRTALIDVESRITYQDLLDRVEQCASGLHAYGIRKGDRVAIYLPRSVDAVVALFAGWFMGAVAVFINDSLKTRQVNYILGHSGASLLVTNQELLTLLHPPGIPDDRIRTTAQISRLAAGGVLPSLIGDDLAMIIYTSGSTGLPKGIMLSHQNLLSGAAIVSDYLSLTSDDVLISLLPFSFDYGLNQLLSSVFVGASLVIQQPVFPADICRCLIREQVTGMACVPLLWQQLASPRSPFTKTRFPKLRYFTNTGGRMPENVTRLFRQAHPDVKIYLMYGLTEAFRSAYLPPEQVDARPTSVGKAIPNVELIVVDEQGRPCKPGQPGELIHRGANISLGYWNDPETTARVFRPNPTVECRNGRPEIVVFSGDTFKTDEEGYLYFVGRKDAMVKSQGMRVSVEEIENCLHASNLLSHVIAFAVDKNEVENEIVAAVVPLDPATFRESDLLAYCKEEMPEYLRPKTIWTLSSFPQTSSGKPDRVSLKDAYMQRK
jgi:acyl-CoA ligase (AMP-forming) (exosortase A-associated)